MLNYVLLSFPTCPDHIQTTSQKIPEPPNQTHRIPWERWETSTFAKTYKQLRDIVSFFIARANVQTFTQCFEVAAFSCKCKSLNIVQTCSKDLPASYVNHRRALKSHISTDRLLQWKRTRLLYDPLPRLTDQPRTIGCMECPLQLSREKGSDMF